MPTYEYECTKCGHRFDVKQGFNDKPGADCPECNKKAKRVFHPSPIIFKGSGFYVTDHRGDSSTTKPAAPKSKDGAAKPETPKAEAPKTEKKKNSD
jgi:putative FmdB family regulatory protein